MRTNQRKIRQVTQLAGLAWLVLGTMVVQATAQATLTGPAYDQITLNAANDRAVLKVVPLQLEGRRVPSPFPTGRLSVRLLDRPGAPYELAWTSIARIDLYEDLLIAEAKKRIDAGKFDEAYPYLSYLHKNDPKYPGLEKLTEAFLLGDVQAAYRAGQNDRAMALLLSLYDRNPKSQLLPRAIDAVSNRVIEKMLKENDLRGARAQLNLLERRFNDLPLKVVPTWRQRFESDADKKAQQGTQLLAAGKRREARLAAADALALWPTHQASKALMKQISDAHPSVLVAVTTPLTDRRLLGRIDSPAGWRAGRLLSPTLTELNGYSQEGGIYNSPLGEVVLDDTARYLEFNTPTTDGQSPNAALLAPYQLSNWLARATNPTSDNFRPSLAQLISTVRVEPPNQVIISLARAYVRPEALLKNITLDKAGMNDSASLGSDAYQDAERLEVELALGDGETVTIEEITYRSDSDAVQALTRNEVDVLADVPPWRVSALKARKDIRVHRYRVPTMHGLIPSKTMPLLDEREFRRAIAYGIDRRRILNELILGGTEQDGFALVSGPFPTGMSLADPIRYGYNDGIDPRPYEPRLATILAGVAWTKVQRAERGPKDPAEDPMPTIRLAHTPSPLARSACQAIQLQLAAIGVPIELVELPEAELLLDDSQYELRYAELKVAEPLVDAARVLGPNGITGRCSDPMLAALDALHEARNWNEVSAALREVHRLAHGDLPFIPLWQTAEYGAHQADLSGIKDSPVNLYSNARQWERN